MTTSIAQRLDKLDASLKNLLKELEPYSEIKLNEKPNEQSWSVFQIMHHLMQSEYFSQAYVEKKLSFNPRLKKAGLVAGFRRVALNAYLASPLKLKAPALVGDNLPEYSTFWEIAKKWKEQRMKLRNYLQELPEDLYDKEIYKHPFAGRLTLDGMLSFFQQHFDRHSNQMMRTLRKIEAVKQR